MRHLMPGVAVAQGVTVVAQIEAANPPAPQLLNHALLSHPTSSRPRLRLLSAKTDAAEL
jgi:hypothetical protein